MAILSDIIGGALKGLAKKAVSKKDPVEQKVEKEAEAEAKPEVEKKKPERSKGGGYGIEKRAVLREEGFEPRGFWFSKDGKMATKPQVDNALNNSFSGVILAKLSLIDSKINKLERDIIELLNINQHQLQMLYQQQQDSNIASQEEAMKSRSPIGRAKDGISSILKPRSFGLLETATALMIPAVFAFGKFLGNEKTKVGFGVLSAVNVLRSIPKIMENAKTAAAAATAKVNRVALTETEAMTATSRESKSVLETLRNAIKNPAATLERATGLGVKTTIGGIQQSVAGAARGAGEAGKAASGAAAGVEAGIGGAAKGGAGVASRILPKAQRILSFLNPLRGALKLIGRFAGLLAFMDPIISLVKLASGEGTLKDVEKSFVKAFGAWFGSEAGVALGAVIGSVVPVFGTIAGAIVGGFAGAAAGQYLAEKLAEIIFDGKNPVAVLASVVSDGFKRIAEIGGGLAGVITGKTPITGKTVAAGAATVLGYDTKPKSDPDNINKPAPKSRGRFIDPKTVGRPMYSGGYSPEPPAGMEFGPTGKLEPKKPKLDKDGKPIPEPKVNLSVSGKEDTATGGTRAMVKNALENAGVTDPKSHNLILANLIAESGLNPRSESLKYTPERLLQVFPKRVHSIEEARAIVAKGPEAIAEVAYGNRMGNKEEGDGYKYRGRGLIQLTGKDAYAAASKALGVDLVKNPDLANEPVLAAQIVPWFLRVYKKLSPEQLKDPKIVANAIGYAGGAKEDARRNAIFNNLEAGGNGGVKEGHYTKNQKSKAPAAPVQSKSKPGTYGSTPATAMAAAVTPKDKPIADNQVTTQTKPAPAVSPQITSGTYDQSNSYNNNTDIENTYNSNTYAGVGIPAPSINNFFNYKHDRHDDRGEYRTQNSNTYNTDNQFRSPETFSPIYNEDNRYDSRRSEYNDNRRYDSTRNVAPGIPSLVTSMLSALKRIEHRTENRHYHRNYASSPLRPEAGMAIGVSAVASAITNLFKSEEHKREENHNTTSNVNTSNVNSFSPETHIHKNYNSVQECNCPAPSPQAPPPTAQKMSNKSDTPAPSILVAGGRKGRTVNPSSENQGSQYIIPSPGYPYSHEDAISAYFNTAEPGFNKNSSIPI